MNFVEKFDVDVSCRILSLLDDPTDLIRATAVSHSWYNLVISNGLCKKLCLRKFPPLSSIARVVEETHGTTTSVDVTSTDPVDTWTLEREHQIFAALLRAFALSLRHPPQGCIGCVIGASSTEHYPEHGIMHTLRPEGDPIWGGSYWSSKGQTDPNRTEYVVYRLLSSICLVTEIHVRPQDGFKEPGRPVYAPKYVRFRMGHPKSAADYEFNIMNYLTRQPAADQYIDDYIWTYTSPKFPMVQERSLQEFKLPEPALCVGGFLRVELLCGAQSGEDGLYYVRLGYVRAMGRHLRQALDLKMETSGELVLKYNRQALDSVLQPTYVEPLFLPDSEVQRLLEPYVAGLLSDDD